VRFQHLDDPEWTSLLKAAWEARSHAYAPYSDFKVGAAIMTRDGRITSGCNVENAAYPATLCAERSTVCASVAGGSVPGDIIALVVVTEAETLTPPCGACRQVLAEFAEDLPILLSNGTDLALHRLKDLLPHAFTGRNLAPHQH
jgi:cytidine deaminase